MAVYRHERLYRSPDFSGAHGGAPNGRSPQEGRSKGRRERSGASTRSGMEGEV